MGGGVFRRPVGGAFGVVLQARGPGDVFCTQVCNARETGPGWHHGRGGDFEVDRAKY